MRPAYFVPESKSCSELFSEMTARRLQIAVVVDEYGGTEGIITMEDLLESIVGNMQDEYDNEEEEIHREGENRFSVDGTASVDEISDLTGVELPGRRLRHHRGPDDGTARPHPETRRAPPRESKKSDPDRRGDGRPPHRAHHD